MFEGSRELLESAQWTSNHYSVAVGAYSQIDSGDFAEDFDPSLGLRCLVGAILRCRWGFGWAALDRWDKVPGYFELGACVAGGHQSVVTRLHESVGKDVKKEPSDELMRRYGYGSFPSGILVVPGKESEPVVADLDEAMVGDGNLVGVAAQVLEDLLRPSERLFGVYDPFFCIEFVRESPEILWLLKVLNAPQEPQLVPGIGLFEKVEKRAGEFLGKSTHR